MSKVRAPAAQIRLSLCVPVTRTDADGHTPIDWIWQISGHMMQAVGFAFHLWTGQPEGQSGNCGNPCNVTSTAEGLAWWDLPGHFYAGFSNTFVLGNGREGLSQMAYAYGSALPLAAGVTAAGGYTLLQLAEDAGATGEEIAEGTASEYSDVTRKGARLKNIQTNIPPEEFGENLERNGFDKEITDDGRAQYTKGNTQYTIYTARSTQGPTAQVKIGGQVVAKIRLAD